MHRVAGLALCHPLIGSSTTPRAHRPCRRRRPITAIYPNLVLAILKLTGDDTQGGSRVLLDYGPPKRATFGRDLHRLRHAGEHGTVSLLLRELGYSVQANRKRFDRGSDRPDQDPQFH
jgi:hypothetical protein